MQEALEDSCRDWKLRAHGPGLPQVCAEGAVGFVCVYFIKYFWIFTMCQVCP